MTHLQNPGVSNFIDLNIILYKTVCRYGGDDFKSHEQRDIKSYVLMKTAGDG